MRRPRVPGVVDKNSNRLLPQGKRPAIPNSTAGITFDLPLNNSGADLVPTTLSYGDGYSINLAWLYRGEDASLSDWADSLENAASLSITGSGASPTLNQDVPLLSGKSLLSSDGGEYYVGTTNDPDHQIDSDFVFVTVLKKGTSSRDYISNNNSSNSTTSQGWLVRDVSDSSIWFVVSDGTDRCRISLGPSGWSEGAWITLVVCGDLSETTTTNSMRASLNLDTIVGASDTPLGDLTDVVNTVSSLEVSNNAVEIAFFGMYKGADVFPGGAGNVTVMDAMIEELASRIMGVYANGNGSSVPSVATRSSAAYLPAVNDSGSERWHYVSQDWPRVGSMLTADGFTRAKGVLIEASRTQQLTETEAFQGNNWSCNLAAVSDGYQTEVTPPVVGANVALLHSEVGSGQHYVTQDFSSTAGVVSLYVKQYPGGNRYLSLGSLNIANRTVDLDFDTGAVDPLASVNDLGVIPCGDGWYRIWLRNTAVDLFRVYTREQNPGLGYNETVAGPQVYLCAPQAESTNGVPTSYIPNTASSGTVSRSSDRLSYIGNDGNISDTNSLFSMDVTAMTIDHNTVSDEHFLNIYENGTNYISLFGVGTSEIIHSAVRGNGLLSNLSLSLDPSDGYAETVRTATLDGYEYFAYTDEESNSTIRSSQFPSGPFSSIHIGTFAGTTGYANGLISSVKIYRKFKGSFT